MLEWRLQMEKDLPRGWKIFGEITFKKTPESVFNAFTVFLYLKISV